jgi:acetyltransferase-like isoleucine patch superfamily enzyme
VSIARYQWNRLRNAWLGEPHAEWKRLLRSGKVVLGRNSYGEPPSVRTFRYDHSRLIVGNYSQIGGTYMLGGQHAIKHVTTYPLRIRLGLEGAGEDGNPARRGDIIVGSDVWTGFGCWIQAGVTIGDGAVVATGAMVTKDVPPYAIVGGIPAQVIKYRHTEEQRAALLEIKWWNWSDEDVLAAVPYLASEDIDAFIEYARARQPKQLAEP